MAELKPCPFCGSAATLCTAITMQHEIAYVVKCDNLECVMCSGGTLRQTISQAENAWNTRTSKELTKIEHSSLCETETYKVGDAE